MAYVPTVWKNGDVITDVKMNKIEQGIANMECHIKIIDATDFVDLENGGHFYGEFEYDWSSVIFVDSLPDVDNGDVPIITFFESNGNYMTYTVPVEYHAQSVPEFEGGISDVISYEIIEETDPRYGSVQDYAFVTDANVLSVMFYDRATMHVVPRNSIKKILVTKSGDPN